jgi:hypothetical protein
MWNLGIVFRQGYGSIEQAVIGKGEIIKQVVGID